MKLIEKEPVCRYVFVGDTHGDFDATQKVFDRYFGCDTTLVFLGDYVDRGNKSRENIDFLLEQKHRYPRGVVLLQGNHENYMIEKFSPADFWYSIGEEKAWKYNCAFQKMPLVFSVGDIIATHGGLPAFDSLEDVNNISVGDDNWHNILWGDFHEGADLIRMNRGRMSHNQSCFDGTMGMLGKSVLIRSHQPEAKMRMFDNRCLTIFTSNAYGDEERTVAIANFSDGKRIRSIDDLEIAHI